MSASLCRVDHVRHSLKGALLAGICSAALAMSAGSASAQVADWYGTTSNDWTVGANWSTGTAPVPGQTINIDTTSPNVTVLGVSGPASASIGITSIGIAAGSTGSLTIQNGSTLTSTGSTRLGVPAGATGNVTVRGAGSRWDITSGTVSIGFTGTGMLNIRDGATVTTVGNTVLGGSATASGTVNIGSGGTLQTQSMRGGSGASQANFDSGILRARANNATFINGFAGTELNLLAGGITIDTAGFAIGTDATSAFTGVGGLSVTGGGTLSLLADNTYSGATSITAGSTLVLAGAGAIASSSRVVADGTFNVSAVTPANATIRSLAGSGSVLLGAKTLEITAANDSFAGVISGTGGLTLSGGTQTLTGANTYSGASNVLGGTLQIGDGGTTGSIVSDVLNNATLAFNRSDTSTYAGQITGTGVVNQIGSGTTILTGINTYSGLTSVNGGTLEVNGSIAGAIAVNAGTLSGIGSVGTTALYAGGIIAPGAGGPGTMGELTINGSYTSNGGILAINAVLGDNSSPADMLLINGDSLLGLAPTLVKVINVGGVGGATTDGIKIVDVAGGTSDAGVFVLNGPAIGGAYKYELFQNGIATPSDGDWYLRNTGLLAPTTPTFENYPVALLGMIDLPTLRQRVGDRTEAAQSIWTRIEGGAGHYEASSSSAGASYDSTLFLAQIGIDGTLHQSSEGSLVAGLTAQYGRHTADVTSSFGDGSNFTESLGVGATLTWRGADGTYLDLQGQLASFATDLDAIGYALVDNNAGGGFAVSLEAGHTFDLDENWALTPQAQLSYASVDFDDFTDHFGSEISLEQGQSLLGRIGVAIDYGTAGVDENGLASASKIYGIANVTYEFLDGAAVVVSGTNLAYSGQKFGGELGLGGTLQWADGAQALQGELLGSSSFEGSYAVKGTLGFTGRF